MKIREGLFNTCLNRESYAGLWFCTKVLRFSITDSEAHQYSSSEDKSKLLRYFFPEFDKALARGGFTNDAQSDASQAAAAYVVTEPDVVAEREPYVGPDGTLTLNQDSMSAVLSYLDLPEQRALSVTSQRNLQCYQQAIYVYPKLFPVQSVFSNANEEEKRELRLQLRRIRASHPPKFLAQMGGYAGIFRIPSVDNSKLMERTDIGVPVNIIGPLRGFDKFGRPFYCAKASIIYSGDTLPLEFIVFFVGSDEREWQAVTNANKATKQGKLALNAMSEKNNKASLASGVDKYGLGARGLAFFARIIQQKPANHPVCQVYPEKPAGGYFFHEGRPGDGDTYLPYSYSGVAQAGSDDGEQAERSVSL